MENNDATIVFSDRIKPVVNFEDAIIADLEVVENEFGDNIEYDDSIANSSEVEVDSEQNKHILGKFDSVEALEEAYRSLQAEFTRKSQELASLKRESNNSEISENAVLNIAEFVERVQGDESLLNEISTKLDELGVKSDKLGLTQAVYMVLSDKIQASKRALQSDEHLYSLISSRDDIKDKIINEYINNCVEGQVPHLITRSYGSGVAVSSPTMPKNFEDIASIMNKWLDNK